MRVETDVLPKRYSEPTRIGQGAMGDIYRARDSLLDRDVAVKVLAERYGEDVEIRERFTREALTAARLSAEPGIVTIFDVGEWGGRPFIVMEYLPGGSLADRLRAGVPETEEALAWLDEAARALDAGHGRGVVHRDVKPGNLLVDRDGHVHVADFGIASATGHESLTMTGTILGTAGYLAPEQASGERASPASDRYALGVVAWELLTGARPFASESPTAEAAAHVSAPPPSLCEHRSDLPCRELDAVFSRALAKEPSERPGSCAELVAELRHALAAGAPATRVVPRVPPRQRSAASASPVRWLVLGAILVAALAGGIAIASALAGDEETGPETGPSTKVRTVRVTQPGTTVRTEVTVTAPAPTATPPPATDSPPSGASGIELTDEATALLQEGRYEEAAATARQALELLGGSGELYEAYALYDLGAALAELGDCKEATKALRRSEKIQGPRSEIDAARAKCD